MTIEQYEIAVPIFALGLGIGGIFLARYSARRLERDSRKRPPAE